MTLNNQQTIESLSALMTVCRDGQDGFKAAARAATSAELKSSLGRFGMERGAFAEALSGEIERLGGKPHLHGSLGGKLHRSVIEFKSMFGRECDSALLRECERGENATVDHYEEQLSRELPEETRTLVETQMVRVYEVRETIRKFASGPQP